MHKYIQDPNNLLALLSKYRIVIPGVQRHYVQGANNPKAESIRKQFVQEILNAIYKEQPLNLHFVYGPINTEGVDSFVPVDGQQRLTTLWLVARYAVERIEPSIREKFLRLLSRFTYEDRINAKRFCCALTQPDSRWNIEEDPNPEMMRQSWFLEYWKEDITVSSMIRMLSTIHQEWNNNYATLSGEQVLEGLGSLIQFELNVDSFGDDIYMKMNARGLQLTQWENFKCKYAENLKDYKEEWEKSIEDLSNRFFEDPAENYELPDNSFFALFSRILAYESNLNCGNNLKALAVFTEWQYSDLPFVPYSEISEVFNTDESLSITVAKTFSVMVNKILANYNTKVPYFSDGDRVRVLFDAIFHPTNINELDFSICCYVYFKSFGDVENQEFLQAIRLMWNILENVVRDSHSDKVYNRVGIINRFIGLGIPTLISGDALNEFKSNEAGQAYEEAQKSVKMSDVNQTRPDDWNEEKLGAWVDWRHAIEFAEKQVFFKGSIRFLYRDSQGNATWKNFATKLCNCMVLFETKGLCQEYKHKANRALISHCDDWSLLIGILAFDIDKDNWKRILINDLLAKCVNNFLLNPDVIAENDNDIIKILIPDNIWSGLIKDELGYRLAWRDGVPALWLKGYPKWTLKLCQNNREDVLDAFAKLPNIRFLEPDYERFISVNDINYYYTRPFFFDYEYCGKEYRFAWQNWGWIDMYNENGKLYDLFFSQYHKGFNIEIDTTQSDGQFCKTTEDFIAEIERCIADYEIFIKEKSINRLD